MTEERGAAPPARTDLDAVIRDAAPGREILFLVHRIPYPPDKGDKIRSWHLLRHLLRRGPVRLGCFVDDRQDWQHADMLRSLCADCHVEPLPRAALPLAALSALARGEALTVAHYRSRRMARWVDAAFASGRVGTAVAFSGAMAPYLMRPAAVAAGVPRLLDFVDVDSAKWSDYAGRRRGPARWLYAREADRLARFETAAAAAVDASILVCRREAELFQARNGGARPLIVRNGVDLDYFRPGDFPDPFPRGGLPLVMTGAMDYRPNADGAQWFAREVLPLLRAGFPEACFWIVGNNPSPEVQRLQGAGVRVTGRVPDIRPYLAHAAAVVAPLRIARGVQNKVLEAMAMARPVVSTPAAAAGIEIRHGRDGLVADTAPAFASALASLLVDGDAAAALGRRARLRVETEYSWPAALAALDPLLEPPSVATRRVA